MRRALLALALAALLLAGCTSPPAAPPPGTPPGTPPGAPGPTPRPAPGFNPLVRLGTDMGDVWIEVYEEMVPITARNFLGYARTGFFEGIKVHRVVGPALAPPDGFMVQMGDPNTRNPTKPVSTWGQGDASLPTIPDELHPALRHSEPGVVSMANAGPNSGSSQFFILLHPSPHLDDKHAVFGRVVAGMDKVRAIGNVQVDGERPKQDITIRSTEVLEAQRDPAQARHGLAAWTYQPAVNTTANHTIEVGVVVNNTGNVGETLGLEVQVPGNWSAGATYPQVLTVAAGMSQVVVLRITTPVDVPNGAYPVTARFNASGAEASVALTVNVRDLGRSAVANAPVVVHYTGTLTDGRLFDADRYDVVTNDTIPKFVGSGRVPGQFTPRPPAGYTPLNFTVGAQNLILGFSEAVFRLREGEQRTAVIPPERAYGASGHPLSGKTLVFTVELLRVG